jgi:hypothetical protein
MAKATRITVRYEDFNGKDASLQFYLRTGVAATDVSFGALIQAIDAVINAKIIGVEFAVDVDISGLGLKTDPLEAQYETVGDQMILQGESPDGLRKGRWSLPTPKSLNFLQTGPFAENDVNPAQAAMVTLLNAAYVADSKLVRTIDDQVLDFDKGWRKGQKHS